MLISCSFENMSASTVSTYPSVLTRRLSVLIYTVMSCLIWNQEYMRCLLVSISGMGNGASLILRFLIPALAPLNIATSVRASSVVLIEAFVADRPSTDLTATPIPQGSLRGRTTRCCRYVRNSIDSIIARTWLPSPARSGCESGGRSPPRTAPSASCCTG